MDRHPNAVVGGASASGLGVLIVYVAGLMGYEIPELVVPVLSGAAAAIVLAIGRDGFCGVARRVWRGSGEA